MILHLLMLLFLVLVLGAAFVLLALALLLYVVPVDVTARARNDDQGVTVSISLEWGIFGLTGRYQDGVKQVRLFVIGCPVLSRTGPEVPAAPVPGEPVHMPDIGGRLVTLRQAWPWISRVLSALIRNLTITRISCRIRYGGPDAATTGRIFGYCMAVLPLQCLSGRVCIEITPVFDREVLEGAATAIFRIHHPLLVCIPGVRMLLDRDTRQALFQAGPGGIST